MIQICKGGAKKKTLINPQPESDIAFVYRFQPTRTLWRG